MQDEGPPPEDTWRILIATDCHLGYMERDPIRRDDSFDAFDEILTKAGDEQADFVLLGGDLFHDNNPSRYTLHRTMSILKKHCFGERAGGHGFEIICDQAEHFQRADYANISDENVRVRMPIFSIHGNHDDPGDAALAALDVLHISSMINYFGKTDVTEDIMLKPLMLRKGESVIALYGLGNIRDERLCRMWAADRVHFAEPDLKMLKSEEERGVWKGSAKSEVKSSGSALNGSQFSTATDLMLNSSVEGRHAELLKVLVLHQNRVPHSGKFYVTEDRVSAFDFVVWGHEHESIVTHTTRMDSEAYISQPGSSVATSLSEGETARKHAVLLQVWKNRYAVTPLPLFSIRPFHLEHISIAALGIPPQLTELQMADAISQRLAQEVERILKEISVSTCTDGSVPNARWNNRKLPLIRLKINYTGYTVINSKRFGQLFFDRVANPADILLFSSKRSNPIFNAEQPPKSKVKGETTSAQSLEEAEQMLTLAPQHTNIDEFLHTHLTPKLGSHLGIFHAAGFVRNLQHYAERDSAASLADSLERQLKEIQLHILSQPELPSGAKAPPTTTRSKKSATIGGVVSDVALPDRKAISELARDFHQQQEAKDTEFFATKTSSSTTATPTKKTSRNVASLGSPTSSNNAMMIDVIPKAEITENELVDDYDQFESVDTPAHGPRRSSARLSALDVESEETFMDDWDEELATPSAGRKRGPSQKSATPAPASHDTFAVPSSVPRAKRGNTAKVSGAKLAEPAEPAARGKKKATSAKKASGPASSAVSGPAKVKFETKTNQPGHNGDPIVIDLDDDSESDAAFLARRSSTTNRHVKGLGKQQGGTEPEESAEPERLEPPLKRPLTVLDAPYEPQAFGEPTSTSDRNANAMDRDDESLSDSQEMFEPSAAETLILDEDTPVLAPLGSPRRRSRGSSAITTPTKALTPSKSNSSIAASPTPKTPTKSAFMQKHSTKSTESKVAPGEKSSPKSFKTNCFGHSR